MQFASRLSMGTDSETQTHASAQQNLKSAAFMLFSVSTLEENLFFVQLYIFSITAQQTQRLQIPHPSLPFFLPRGIALSSHGNWMCGPVSGTLIISECDSLINCFGV